MWRACLCFLLALLPDPPFRPVTGRKADRGKLRWDILPWSSLGPVVEVLAFGAGKYAPDNWQRVPQARSRYFAAAVRHLIAWYRGEKNDPETGLPHLAHALCCLLFLLWFERGSP